MSASIADREDTGDQQIDRLPGRPGRRESVTWAVTIDSDPILFRSVLPRDLCPEIMIGNIQSHEIERRNEKHEARVAVYYSLYASSISPFLSPAVPDRTLQ